MKICFKCSKNLPLSAFYKHKEMDDGHLGKCKECTKKDTIKNRKKNIEYYREYDRKRSGLKHRILLNRKRWLVAMNSPSLKRKIYDQKIAWNRKNKLKRSAHSLTGSAIKCGRLIKKPCEMCGKKKVEAHHDDYYKPLSVRWLCKKHHMEHHKNEREHLRNN